MKLRLCTILIGLFVLQVVSTLSCGSCGAQRYFTVIDLFLESNLVLSDSPIEVEELSLNDHVKIGKFSMRLTTGLEYAENEQKPYLLSPFSFPTALASCNKTPLPTQQISNFSIISNADFTFADEVFIAAGQKMNNYLLISFDGQNRIPLKDFLSSNDSHPMEVPLYIFLNGDAAYNQIHRFTVNYVLNDGQTFTASTEKVIITPN